MKRHRRRQRRRNPSSGLGLDLKQGATGGLIVAGSMLALGISTRFIPALDDSAFARTVKRVGVAGGLSFLATKARMHRLSQGLAGAAVIQTLFDLAVSSIPRTQQINPPSAPANAALALGAPWRPY